MPSSYLNIGVKSKKPTEIDERVALVRYIYDRALAPSLPPTGTPLDAKEELPESHLGKDALEYFKGNIMGRQPEGEWFNRQRGEEGIYAEPDYNFELGELDPPGVGTVKAAGKALKSKVKFDNVIEQPGGMDPWYGFTFLDGPAEGGSFTVIKKGKITEEDIINAGQNILNTRKPTSIKGAAIKLKNGEIFIGKSHTEAMEAFDRAGYTITDWHNLVEDSNGFITNTGKFITRKQAVKITGSKTEDALDIIK